MIRGDVSTFLNALGAKENDPQLERALALVGGTPEVESFVDGGVKSTYLSLEDRGVEFLLTDGELSTVFFSASSGDGVYAGWPTLIEGVRTGSTREQIVRALGEPLRSRDAFVTYEVDTGFVQFDFDGDVIKTVVVMRELIGGRDPQPQGDEVATEVAVDGEIAAFVRAVGLPMFSREHVEVMTLAGPSMETHEDARGGANWTYDVFPSSGVTLQFKDEVLVGALIELVVKDGASVYPSLDLLISGLSLPSSRDDIQAHFGKPERSSQYMDLYLVGDRYLRFDFESGLSTAVTVVQPGVEL